MAYKTQHNEHLTDSHLLCGATGGVNELRTPHKATIRAVHWAPAESK